jgi:hypothetical protein
MVRDYASKALIYLYIPLDYKDGKLNNEEYSSEDLQNSVHNAMKNSRQIFIANRSSFAKLINKSMISQIDFRTCIRKILGIQWINYFNNLQTLLYLPVSEQTYIGIILTRCHRNYSHLRDIKNQVNTRRG